jgi:hypothetical protein
MVSTHTAYLDIPALPLAARLVHIVPALQTQSLLSLPQLCSNGCKVTLDNDTIHIELHDKVIMSGNRCDSTGFWHLDVAQPSASPTSNPHPANPHVNLFIKDYHANAAVGHAGPAELVEFAHAAMWSPSLSTLEKALLKGYINLPGLTSELLRKHPPNSRATAKGHLNQTRQGTKSTRTTKPEANSDETPTADDNDFEPTSLSSETDDHTHECYAALIQPSGLVYTDQTGRFLCPSESGNNYLMVMYDYDSNAILAEPVPNRSKKCLLEAYKKLHAALDQTQNWNCSIIGNKP